MNARTTVMRFLVESYAPRQKLAKRSIDQHRWIVGSLNDYSGTTILLADLSTQLALDWLHGLRRRGLSAVTVKNHRRHLLTLWAAAYRAGIIDAVPNIPQIVARAPQTAIGLNLVRGDASAELRSDMLLRDYVQHYRLKRSICIATVYQYEVSVASLDTWNKSPVRLDMLCDDLVNRWLMRLEGSSLAAATRGYYPSKRWVQILHTRIRRAQFWELLIRIAWDTGLRSCDIMRLCREQFDESGVAELVQEKTARWHLVRVHDETLRAIQAGGSSGRIVEWLNTREWLNREFVRLVTRAGIRKGTFKRLRKSSATDVELHYPGCGAAHLGHVIDGKQAKLHYLDPRLLIKTKPMPQPLRVSSEKGGAA